MDINETLAKMPARKARAATEAENFRFEWQTAKEELRRLEAETILKVKAEYPDLTVQEQKAKADDDEKLYQKRLDVLVVESKYRKKEVESRTYDDMFTSAKRLAQIKIEEMKQLGTTVGG
jgi:hypothetical protein